MGVQRRLFACKRNNDNPVVFKEIVWRIFQDDYEQWDRIWINEGTQDNIINYAIIKNAFIGIQAEILEKTWAINSFFLIRLLKSAGMGFLGKNYKVEAYNNIISDCGQHCVALILGGNYQFTNNTIYNFYKFDSRATSSVFFSNYYIIIMLCIFPIFNAIYQ